MTKAQVFRRIELRMQAECPDMVRDAEELAADIGKPERDGPSEVWRHMWNKPLFANTMVQIGLNWVAQLTPFVEGDLWRQWGDPTRPYLTLNGPANRNDSFAYTDYAPPQLRELPITKKRLFAVQGAAQALARWSAQSAAPLIRFVPLDRHDLVPTMMHELGRGWGHITTMHFLTDVGLSVKPDRWLVRTMVWANLGGNDLTDILDTNRAVPSLPQAIAIDLAVKKLVIEVDGVLTPRRLRYFDKILMEASRQGIVEHPRPESGSHCGDHPLAA
ncbi:hypothetical protein ABVV53_08690 [Novosphingobium sp. RD2P27]|uniref:Uncharacterized protein n=1 Tax=Novosphingobium kalidii TaxID=3230299 RepID=A0ABV2D1G6_9SPHN